MRDVLIHAALLLKLVHTLNYLSPIASILRHTHIPRQNFFIIIFIRLMTLHRVMIFVSCRKVKLDCTRCTMLHKLTKTFV